MYAGTIWIILIFLNGIQKVDSHLELMDGADAVGAIIDKLGYKFCADRIFPFTQCSRNVMPEVELELYIILSR